MEVLVDVGGNEGASLQMITSKHPHIKGVNYDLPHVISGAQPLDLYMLVCTDEGRERSEEEFKDLAREAGFPGFKAAHVFADKLCRHPSPAGACLIVRTTGVREGYDNMMSNKGSCGSRADSKSFLENDDRPGVLFTRIQPRVIRGHGRGFPRPHHPSPRTSGYDADHSPIPTPAHAFDSSPIGSSSGTPTNGVTSNPKPRGPARGGAVTALGRRSQRSSPTLTPARSQSHSCDPIQTGPDFDTLSSDTVDSLREQVRRFHQRLDEVQKEVLKSRGKVRESSKDGSPFTPEIQAKPLPAAFRLPTLEPYDGNGDPMKHIAAFRAQMALYDTSDVLIYQAFSTTLRGPAKI
ncbi:hypothetical protein B296_00027152 [Ensete ventricosum]|uniref:O-methyltransferase C-terminal domain-containing protein n=1 Tax=Ensete ventricosum TaxID=4639 RepID=A0A426Z904_ENSVE|nr:hypothetical protein B296_00027152 [Ensete ventricosum]